MNFNFNLIGAQGLVEALRKLKESIDGSAKRRNEEEALRRSKNKYDTIVDLQEKINKLKHLKALGRSPIDNVSLQDLIDQFQAKLNVIASIPSSIKSSPGKPPKINIPSQDPDDNSNKSGIKGLSSSGMARVIGASLRALSNFAPYQIGSLISTGSFAGPIGLAVAAVVTALGIFTAAIIASAKTVDQFTVGKTTAIANDQEFKILRALSNYSGVDLSTLSSIANKEPGGAVVLLEKIRHVLNIPDERQRQLAIRSMGLPPEIEKLMHFPEDLKNAILSGNVGSTPNQDSLRGSAEVSKFIGNWHTNIQNLQEKFLGFLGNVVPKARESLDNGVLGWIPAANKAKNLMDVLQGDFSSIFDWKNIVDPTGMLSTIVDRMEKFRKANDSKTSDKLDKAASKLERAAASLEAYTYNNKSGIFGGIDPARASKGFPSNWAYAYDLLRKQNLQDTMYMGAFVL